MKFLGSRIALLFYHCGQNFQHCVVSYIWLEYVHKICPSSLNVLNASINSKREHPPAKPRGIFEEVKSLPRGNIFLQKHGPRDKKCLPPGVFWKIWSAFPVNRSRNFWILQKSNFEKNWKAAQLFFGHTL